MKKDERKKSNPLVDRNIQAINKDDIEWHRTFNNQNLQFMSVYAMVTLPWLAGFVLLCGIIMWLLTHNLLVN